MGRFLAIDHGSKRIGLALSDPMKIIAKPFKTLTYINFEDLFSQIENIIKDNEVDGIIVGLPRGMKFQETAQTKIVLKFIALLKSKINIFIDVQDERLSSVSAEKSLVEQNIKTGHNKLLIDQTAAAIFLQQYLDTRR